MSPTAAQPVAAANNLSCQERASALIDITAVTAITTATNTAKYLSLKNILIANTSL
jgi:hypothetical protein